MDSDDHWLHLANLARFGAYLTDHGVPPADLFRRRSLDPIGFLDVDALLQQRPRA